MAVLLLAEVNGNELAVDATAKAVSAATALCFVARGATAKALRAARDRLTRDRPRDLPRSPEIDPRSSRDRPRLTRE